MWRIILSIIVILLFLIFIIPIKIKIEYDNKFSVTLKVLFYKKSIYDSEQTVNVKKFTAKGIKKQLDKDRNSLKKKEKPKEKEAKDKDIAETIKLLNDIILSIKDKFFRYLRIDLASLKVIVATDDAAKTAIQYGVVVQLVQYTVTILQNITNFTPNNSTSIICDVDYLKTKSEFSCNISFTLKLWHILAIGLSAGAAYIKNSKRQHRKGGKNAGN